MEKAFNGSKLNQKTIFDHPTGLFVLFFTEMWERFSYYGMRAILVLFLTSSILDDGWGWERKEALELFAWYTSMVYLTPLLGGILADRYTGYRNAVVIGALVMALGHGSLALESITRNFFYLGLILLVIGNGLFKPNISSIVGQLYKDGDTLKDGGYTIFYMGINAGAFLGILLCGYLGEKVGWHYGFGLAGIFMFFGMLQFYYAQSIFGKIGLKPNLKKEVSLETNNKEINSSNQNKKIEKDRILVIIIFSIATIFFWWAFEQAGGSMTIFANDYTDRELFGNSIVIFNVINTIITIVPMVVITYVLIRLFQNIFQSYLLSNIFLGISFIIIWSIVIYMLSNEISQKSSEIPASWFSMLNALFIILLAPLFSKIWASKYNPSGPKKFGIGLILLGIGYLFVSYGALGIPAGAQTASVSLIWLVYAYFFHTTGELCLSPVGLSYVSKLAPARLIGLMFGIWLLSSAVANFLAGITGSYIDSISNEIGLNGFFAIFALVPISAGLVMFLLNNFLSKKMHGVK